MGAGYYVLCENGHVIGCIEENLYWGNPEDKNSIHAWLERLESSNCSKCGKIAKYKFCHYGDINDCLPFKLKFNKTEDRWIIPNLTDPYQCIELERCIIKRKSDVKNETKEIKNEIKDEFRVTKALGTYNIMSDNGNIQIELRMKEEDARNVRDKLDALLPRTELEELFLSKKVNDSINKDKREKLSIGKFNEKGMNLHQCDKKIFVRLRKDLGFHDTGNYGFCTIHKNSMGALQACCETVCPRGLKVEK